MTTTQRVARLLRTGVSPHLGGAVGLVLVALVAGTLANPYWLFNFSTIAIYVLVALGMNVLFGLAGQASLAQGALLGISAYGTAILAVKSGWSFWPAALVGVAAACLVAALMSLAAARLAEWFFALITLTFAVLFQGIVNSVPSLTGGYAGLVGMRLPTIAGRPLSPVEFFGLAVVIAGVFAWAVAGLVRSRIGRGMVALRTDPPLAGSVGASGWRLRLLAFQLAALSAGMGGALFAALQGVVTADSFDLSLSIFFLVAVVIGGAGSLWGPVVGTIVFFSLPLVLRQIGEWDQLVYGVCFLIVTAFAPRGLVGLVQAATDRLGVRGRVREIHYDDAHSWTLGETASAWLSLRGVTVRFGGVTALDDVELDIEPGQVTAIVGSNGSGKTTLLNVLSGFYRPDAGSALIDGSPLRGTAEHRARQGIGRTFQTPKLLAEDTVLNNVILGAYVRESANLLQLAFRTLAARREHARLTQDALRLLRLVGVADLWSSPAGQLPHGQQRLVEIARALMGVPKVLLLDEPAAGLSPTEMDRLGELLSVVRESGITVVIVEHHLELVSGIADRVALFDDGRLVSSGSVSEVFSMASTVESFMGASGAGD